MLAILLVDDEPMIRIPVSDALRERGHRVTVASDGADAVTRIESEVFDLVVSDVRLPKVDGFTLLRKIRSEAPSTDVLLMTAYGTIEDAVAAMKEKAIDYVTKPFDIEELAQLVDRIAERRGLERELQQARARLCAVGPDAVLIGRSAPLVRVKERIEAIAPSDASVLVTGESGTGKELVARMVHGRSGRHDKPFVAINCSAIPPALLEAELFGYERGAFTGAMRRREGKFQAADGGTLFLDEIGEMPLDAQVKLLRVLQGGEFEPIGSNASIKVDVRVVSATHRDLKACVAEGRFREDLYYRIRVFDVRIPPLRERPTDLPLLVAHFLERFARRGLPCPTVSPSAWAAITHYPFPGNVRELEHAIEHAVVLAQFAHAREIEVDHLPTELRQRDERRHAAVSSGAAGSEGGEVSRSLPLAIEEFEREYIYRALKLAGGEKKRASELLGVSRKCLWQKLRKYGDAEALLHDGDHEAAADLGHDAGDLAPSSTRASP